MTRLIVFEGIGRGQSNPEPDAGGNMAFPHANQLWKATPVLPAAWAHACWSSHPGSMWIGWRNESFSRAGSSWKRALLMTVNLSSFPAQKLGAVCADNPIYLLISAPFTLNYWAHSCQLQLVISWVCVWRTQETFSSDKYRKNWTASQDRQCSTESYACQSHIWTPDFKLIALQS